LFGLWAGGISYRKECDDQGVIKKGPRSFLIAVLFTFGLLGATMGCGGQSQTQAQKQHAAEVEQHKRAGNAAIDRFNAASDYFNRTQDCQRGLADVKAQRDAVLREAHWLEAHRAWIPRKRRVKLDRFERALGPVNSAIRSATVTCHVAGG